MDNFILKQSFEKAVDCLIIIIYFYYFYICGEACVCKCWCHHKPDMLDSPVFTVTGSRDSCYVDAGI